MLSSIEEIKSRLDLVDLIQEYIQLKPAGINFRALCPFHNEKTPSFFVSPEKQIWHCFGCFPKGSLIKIKNGLLPIEKINRGDFIISGKGNEEKVELTMKRNFKGNLISIKTRKFNYYTTLTEDHMVYVVKTINCKQKGRKSRLCQSRCKQNCPTKYFKNYKITKIRADQLKINDYLIYPIIKKIQNVDNFDLKKFLTRRLTNYGKKIRIIPEKFKLNEDFLKLLGYYIAEGSNHRAYIRFSLGNHEWDFAYEIQGLIKKIFNLSSSIYRRKNKRSGVELTCCNSNLSNIFENLCGKLAINKHIPFELNIINPNKQKIILQAILKGDGAIAKAQKKTRGGEKNISTISKTLAYQLVDILLRLGYQPTLNIRKARVDKENVFHKESYNIYWREDLRNNYTDFMVKDKIRYWLLPVKDIKKIKFKGEVHNLTVKDDHSYIASHFAVANCGKGGDLFAFIQEIEGLEFAEALKILAEKAGIKLKFTEPKSQTFKNILWQINKDITDFWQKNLWQKAEFEPVRQYLRNREIKDETAKTFLLGFASDSWQEAINFLKSRDYNEKEIFQAGLSVLSEKNKEYYDRFRNRIIFPIQDLQGNIVGFGGRIFEEKNKEVADAKYLNSPQTTVYNKSLILYGLDKAKLEIKKKDYVIIVEGYFDLISAYQAGTRNIVASSGTALTFEQLRILKRYTNNLMICFDADLAGQKAAERGIDLALASEFNLKIIELKDFKDPDECIRHDKNKWFEAIKSARHFVDYYFDKTTKKLDLARADHKKKAASILLGVISRLPNLIDQTHYLQKLAKIINVPENVLREILTKKGNKFKAKYQSPEIENLNKLIDKRLIISQRLLALVFKYPAYLKILIDNLEPAIINQVLLQELYKSMVNYYNLNQRFTTEDFIQSIREQRLIDEINKLSLLGDNEYEDWEDNLIQNEIINNINFLKKDYYTKRLQEITEAIKISEKDQDEEKLKILSEEFNKISHELRDLK